MLSNKPYLIRAFYAWIVDSGCTPFIVINANHPKCMVPQNFVENGEITLNISPTAIRDFQVTNKLVEFRASFSGMVHLIVAPVKAVLAIYAQENQQGMFFDYEDTQEDGDGEEESDGGLIDSALSSNQTMVDNKEKRSHLKLVE